MSSFQPTVPSVLINAIKLAEGTERALKGNFVHTQQLISALTTTEQLCWHILVDEHTVGPITESVTHGNIHRVELGRSGVMGADAAVWSAIRRLRPNIYHRPHGQLPFVKLPARTVATLVDVKFRVLKTNPIQRLYKEASYLWTVKQADWITCVSDYIRHELIRLGADPNRLTTIKCGATPLPPPEYLIADRIGKPFWITFAHQPHKNVEAVIEALAMLPESLNAHQLVVIGASTNYNSKLAALASARGVAERVIFAGRVSSAQLHALYLRSRALLFLSIYEGFGLPLLEAMSVGCPIICSNVSSLPEVAGNAALLVMPHDHRALANAMIMLEQDSFGRAELMQLGTQRAKEYTWRTAADQTLEVYDRLLRETPAPS
jgi:glycosyltransferase involved in cell wall biosynthesis